LKLTALIPGFPLFKFGTRRPVERHVCLHRLESKQLSRFDPRRNWQVDERFAAAIRTEAAQRKVPVEVEAVEVKDEIGEWPDWTELSAVAQKGALGLQRL